MSAPVLLDRAQETSTTTGTGTLTLLGAVAGYRSLAGVGDGNLCYYTAVDAASGDWETGIGTYTASGTKLARTTVLSSSNAGSLVSFAAGTRNVFIDVPASKNVYTGQGTVNWDAGTVFQAGGSAAMTLNSGGSIMLSKTLFAGAVNFATFLLSGGQFLTPITKTASASLNNSQGTILVDATAGNVVLTLPPALTYSTYGQMLQITRIDTTSAHTVTVQRAGSDTIDAAAITSFQLGVPSALAGDGHAVTLQADGVSVWYRTNFNNANNNTALYLSGAKFADQVSNLTSLYDNSGNAGLALSSSLQRCTFANDSTYFNTRAGHTNVYIDSTGINEMGNGISQTSFDLTNTWTDGVIDEVITVASGSTTTDSTGNLLPANSLILAVNAYVTTAISAGHISSIGDATTPGRFTGTSLGLIAVGSSVIGMTQWSGASVTLATGPSQAANAKVRLTRSSSASTTGAVHVLVFYRKFANPTG
jgi:hypothetical protein